MSGLTVLVLSRNRPAQLDLLLSSIKRNAPLLAQQIQVLYRHDTVEFKEGYRRVAQEWPQVEFLHELDFQGQVRQTLRECETKCFAFMCDDDIIYRYHTESVHPASFLAHQKDVLAVSLRLGKGLTKCYSMKQPQKEPGFLWRNGMYVFSWPGKSGDYGYVGSVDGDVFRTPQLRVLLQNGSWQSPNELEVHLNFILGATKLQHMACYKQSLLIGNPANSVQTSVSENRNMRLSRLSPERLNQLFLDGRRLRVENLKIGAVRAVHHEVDISATEEAE